MQNNPEDDYIEDNRRGWNLRTGVHLDSTFYNVKDFRDGGLSLKSPERALCGSVEELKLLHLQCHFGMDTLSWARLGAVVTGVDFSPAAIKIARNLGKEVGISANFIQADVQSLGDQFNYAFDRVVSTYGVLCWLKNLDAWAQSIRCSLSPQGQFILVEFHPLLDLLYDGIVSGHNGYFGGSDPVSGTTKGTYTDRDATITYKEHRWQHPISNVVSALLRAGLHIINLQEYPYSSYPLFPLLDTERDGLWYPTKDIGRVPFMYSIVAEAPCG